MKKKKAKNKAEAQEVKIRYEPGRMIFEAGGQEFYLTEETAGSIFGRSVGLEFERLHGQDESFGGLKSLTNFVKIQRLMKKGLNYSQIGKALNFPEQQIREFYNFETRRPRVESFDSNAVENERKRQAEAEMDFVEEVARPQKMNEQEAPEPGERFVDLRGVKNLQRQGMKNGKIAEYLGVDGKEFEKFMGKNEKYLRLLP